MRYIYTTEYYSATERGDVGLLIDMDGPTVCHTERRKSERDISYVNAYMWNLEKWYS